ncbi:MAG: putative zinc-binding metallopeptidase [Methylococcales bacterium]|nr:putative zinc-binding metallopeptidase [Methylococcales bacterium]
MKRFYCRCGNEVFFENIFCNVCFGILGFIPEQQTVIKLEKFSPYRVCAHRSNLNCNWLVRNTDANSQCLACRLTRTIPNLGVNNNLQRWARLEATKRRAFYMLLRLQLAIPDRFFGELVSPLLFDFLEDRRSNRLSKLDMVYTGHAGGVITINAAEADDSYRSAAQHKMKEAYRTLLGHFRHEMGHYYWMQLAAENQTLGAFRQIFGDDRQDYQAALKYFYRHGARSDWQNHFISAYASAHPLEDWAECWAHYLHICETLETACTFDLVNLEMAGDDFTEWLCIWKRFSVVLNALNRSMGVGDPYPFVINATVESKLRFIERWVKTGRV